VTQRVVGMISRIEVVGGRTAYLEGRSNAECHMGCQSGGGVHRMRNEHGRSTTAVVEMR